MVGVPGIASAIFSTVRDANINVVMISQVDPYLFRFDLNWLSLNPTYAQNLVEPRISIRQAGIE